MDSNGLFFFVAQLLSNSHHGSFQAVRCAVEMWVMNSVVGFENNFSDAAVNGLQRGHRGKLQRFTKYNYIVQVQDFKDENSSCQKTF